MSNEPDTWNPPSNYQESAPGVWTPAIPEPWYIGRKVCRCDCGQLFWTRAAYRSHYQRIHLSGSAQVSAKVSRFKWFPCAKCGKLNADYDSFGARDRAYCLHHIPRLVRLSMWLRRVR